MKLDNTTVKQLFEINETVEKLPKYINKAKSFLINNDINSYKIQSEKLLVELEKSVLKTRQLINNSYKKYGLRREIIELNNKIAEQIYGIELDIDDDITHISLPLTLPKYRDSYKTILYAPLNNLFEKSKKDGINFPDYSSAIIVVINHISGETNKKFIRDNDNYEYKQLINTVCFWLLADDNYRCANMMNGVKIDDRDYTEIFVIPKDRFGIWFDENKGNIFS